MKSPFDIAKEITSNKGEWNEEIQSAWNTFMVNRALSMNPENIEVVDYVQRYFNIPVKNIYDIYRELIGKDQRYYQYIKSKNPVVKEKPLKDFVINKIKKSESGKSRSKNVATHERA